MKKFFTLFVAVLLSSGAFAQSTWKDLVINGDMEGAADPLWSSFWCHDWREGVEFDPASNQQYDGSGQFQGFAEIVEDPANPANHCARVIVRSDEEAVAAGNRVEANGGLASWDCQFFIYSTQSIAEGMEVKMTLKVKAEKDGSFETQAHYTPGDYNHWQMFGNVNYGTEWQEVEVSTTVTADQTKSADGKYFQSVAFNLSTMKDGNVIYFDDVKLEVREPEPPHELSEWLDIVRDGVKSKDEIVFGNGTFTTFTGRDGVPGIDQPARIVTDPLGVEPVIAVSSVAADYYRENLNDEGEVQSTTPMYIVREGNLNTSINVGDSVELTDWQSQFFVSHKHVFRTGQKIRFACDARADKPANISTQIHKGPGDYLHWQLFGDLSLTEEWQHFEYEQDVTSDQNGGSTVAFNLNVFKDEDNTYYFKNFEFSCNEADATEEERTIASELVVLPVSPSKEEADATHTSVSLKAAKEALLMDDVLGLISDDNMKLQTADGTLSEEFYTPEVGFYMKADGTANGETGDFIIEVAEDEDNADSAIFTVYNLKGYKLSDQVKSRLAFDQKGWFYLVNLTLCNEDEYMGISNAQTTVKNGAVYDLSGRKVVNPVKGIYIQNGKKFVIK
ncbi:MAG: hypothetical protein IKX69_06570 [Prevotella sp.]|nr:hypothetical protein [Prevotella sp.]